MWYLRAKFNLLQLWLTQYWLLLENTLSILDTAWWYEMPHFSDSSTYHSRLLSRLKCRVFYECHFKMHILPLPSVHWSMQEVILWFGGYVKIKGGREDADASGHFCDRYCKTDTDSGALTCFRSSNVKFKLPNGPKNTSYWIGDSARLSAASVRTLNTGKWVMNCPGSEWK